MGILNRASLAFVAMSSVLLTVDIAAGQQSGTSFTHPGRALDMKTSKPVKVSVKAWPKSEQTGEDGNCVMYGDAPLDATFSNAKGGQFTLKINSAKPTYTVVYCENEYHTRVDRDIPNSSDGTPVMPTPARLWPVAASTSASTEFNDAVVRRAVIALNELAYLQSINKEQFDSAIANYAEIVGKDSDRAAEALINLPNLAAAWAR